MREDMTKLKDILEDLKTASPEELLEAYIWFYAINTDLPEWWERAVKAGFALAQPDGWKSVAPAWLEEYRQTMKEFEKRHSNIPFEVKPVPKSSPCEGA